MDLVPLTWTPPPPPPKCGLCFFTIVLSLFSKGHCSTLHIYYGSVYTNKQGKSFSYSYYSSSSSYYSSVKIFPATSQSSSSQATEPIVKCHTILEMGSHDLSQHADLGPHFGRGFKQNLFWTYFLPREGLIGWTKIQLKNLKFDMGVP